MIWSYAQGYGVSIGAIEEGDLRTNLVVPPVRTRANLHTVAELVRAAKEVVAQLRRSGGGCTVEANDEESVVDDFQAGLVGSVAVERVPQVRPGLSVLSGEHSNRLFGDLSQGNCGIVRKRSKVSIQFR